MTKFYFELPGTKHQAIIEAEDQKKADEIFDELLKSKTQ